MGRKKSAEAYSSGPYFVSVSIYNQKIKQGNPIFHIYVQAQKTDTQAFKQHRLSQNSFSVCSSFVLVTVSDIHESE